MESREPEGAHAGRGEIGDDEIRTQMRSWHDKGDSPAATTYVGLPSCLSPLLPT
jgi:hypothetical protein